MQHLMKSDIFRINYFNMLSSIIQKKEDLLQPLRHHTVKQKILQFLRREFAEQDGQVEIYIKMTVLADYISETRLNTSRALNELEDAKIVELKRSLIVIPDMGRIRD